TIGGEIWGKPYVTHFWQDCNTTFIMSWDDARSSDVYLGPIDEKFGISHTLFAPSYRSYPNYSFWRYAFLLDELFRGHDIQSHCGKHIKLSKCSEQDQEYFVKWGKTGIEELFSFTPIVFAYPYGDLGGEKYVKEYFDLGRTIKNSGTSWPPVDWHEEGTTISLHGINDGNLNQIISIMKNIYRKSGYQVFKGYGHTNSLGKDYGVTNFTKYADTIAQIAYWSNVWYTTWGELVSYEIAKEQLEFSKVECFPNKLEFEVSTSSINPTIYKIPITVAILIPKFWTNPFPQINGKFSSKFSLKNYADSIELNLDVVPQEKPQKIIIWNNAPVIDHTPPEIVNFQIKTKYVNECWDKSTQIGKKFTFMRFDVLDEQSDINQVNASVFLKNGEEITFSKMKNPLFWKNSTYGRVVWDSTILNKDIPQVHSEDIYCTHVNVQDGFGNIRHSIFYSCGYREDFITQGGQSLLRMQNKQNSSLNRLEKT
ncbi:MAG: polysaccharide deacetylase family protein, partial [Promethearchaeota archaeon]